MIRHDITGGAYPLLRVRLAPGETVEAEVRAFVGLRGEADIKSIALRPSKKNVKAAIAGKKRGVTNRFTAISEVELLLTSGVAGEIAVLEVSQARALRLAPGAYIASEAGVALDVEIITFSKTSRMALIQLTGQGRVFLGASGAAHQRPLGDGEAATVDRQHLLACDGGMTLQDVSESGLWPTITGQDLVRVTGPGRLVLQSLPRAPRASPVMEAVKAVTGLL